MENEKRTILFVNDEMRMGGVARVLNTLMAALPKGLPGQPPLHGAETPGCAFAPRCPHAQPGCGKKAYTMRQIGARHFACCTGRV